MVTLLALALLSVDPTPHSADLAARALAKGHYPWYDSAKDAAKPVPLPPDWRFNLDFWPFNMRGGGGLRINMGQVLATIFLVVLLAILVTLIVLALKEARVAELTASHETRRTGTA